MYRFIVLATLLTLHASLPTLGAAEPAEPEYAESIERLDPMDTTGLDSGLAVVLRNYYQRNFTSLENWQQIESIRFDGSLHLPQGVVRFTAFKKKPDLCKIVIYMGNGGRVVMAYDGADAWQLNTLAPDAAPRTMPEPEALNFIRDATTGGHLFYPQLKGKTISLLGIADVDGQRAYHLRVQLPDGQVIQSFLDMTTFAEIRQVTVNNMNGNEETLTHDDFRQIDGVYFPFVSTLTVDGQQVHQSRMSKIQPDVGVMPWMFRRPSGDDLPEGATDSTVADSLTPAGEAVSGSEASVRPLSESSFESISPSSDIWAPSVFSSPTVPLDAAK